MLQISRWLCNFCQQVVLYFRELVLTGRKFALALPARSASMIAESPFVLRGQPFSAYGWTLFGRAPSQGAHISIVHIGSIAEKLLTVLTD